MKLTIKIEHRFKDKILFEPTQLVLESNKINFLLGPNGSGKSSLAYFLAQLKKPTSIQILKDDQKLTKKESKLFRNQTRYLFQNPIHQLLHLKVMEELEFNKKDFDKEEALELLKHFNFSLEDIEKQSNNLSFGQMRKLLIVEALLSKVDFFIFDEPTSNLDQESKEEFILLVQSLIKEKDKFVLIISHDLNLLEQIGDVFHLIHNNEIQSHLVEELDQINTIYDSNSWSSFYDKIVSNFKDNFTKQDLKTLLGEG